MAADGIGQVASGAGAAGSAGLVLSPTSQTGEKPGSFIIDRDLSRARRCRKSIITGARLHVEEATKGGHRGRWAMVTATYAPGRDASPRHVSGLVQCIRSYLHRLGRRSGRTVRLRYLWTLEVTKRGVPHYHLLVRLPSGVTLPKPDKRGWWQHGATRIEWARNAVGYLAKYASKFTPDAVRLLPKGFRTHAVGGLDHEGKRELRWWKAPEGARQALGLFADIRKVASGYLDRITGSFWLSPWRVFLRDGQLFAFKDPKLCALA